MRIKLKLMGVREVSGDSLADVLDQLPAEVRWLAEEMFRGVDPERLYHARVETSPQDWMEVESDAYLEVQRRTLLARGAPQGADALRALESALDDMLAIDPGRWVAKVTDGGTDIESKATDDVICFVASDDDDPEDVKRSGTIFSYLVAAQPLAVRTVLDLLAPRHDRAPAAPSPPRRHDDDDSPSPS